MDRFSRWSDSHSVLLWMYAPIAVVAPRLVVFTFAARLRFEGFSLEMEVTSRWPWQRNDSRPSSGA